MDSRVTPPKRVTSPTWAPPPPCKHALRPKIKGSEMAEASKTVMLPRVWKEGVLIPHFHTFFTKILHPDFFHRYPEYPFLSKSTSMLKFGRIPLPGRVAVNSRIPSTFSRIPHCILVKSRIPSRPFSLALCVCEFHDKITNQ